MPAFSLARPAPCDACHRCASGLARILCASIRLQARQQLPSGYHSVWYYPKHLINEICRGQRPEKWRCDCGGSQTRLSDGPQAPPDRPRLRDRQGPSGLHTVYCGGWDVGRIYETRGGPRQSAMVLVNDRLDRTSPPLGRQKQMFGRQQQNSYRRKSDQRAVCILGTPVSADRGRVSHDLPR